MHGMYGDVLFFFVAVTCRLVKDYRRVITLRALCQQAQLLVSRTAVVFPSPLMNEDSMPLVEEVSDSEAADGSDEHHHHPTTTTAAAAATATAASHSTPVSAVPAITTETLQIRNPSKHPLVYVFHCQYRATHLCLSATMERKGEVPLSIANGMTS